MKQFYANGITMSQILGFSKPKEEESDEDKAEELYKKRLARLRQMERGVQEGEQELSNGQIPDQVRDDGKIGEEVQINDGIISTFFHYLIVLIDAIRRGRPACLPYRIWRTHRCAPTSTLRRGETSFAQYIATFFNMRANIYCLRRALRALPLHILTIFVSGLFTEALAQSGLALGERAVAGVEEIKPIRVGQKVPEEFWTTEHLFYIDGDTVRRTLEANRGKILVLDFWSTTCGNCTRHFPEINHFKKTFPEKLSVVMVNSRKTRDSMERIAGVKDRKNYAELGFGKFETIIMDAELDRLFEPVGYPYYVWINQSEYVQSVTFRNLLNRKYQPPFIDR